MITLREYNKYDVVRLVQLANNKNVSKYLAPRFPFPYTKQDSQWWIETGCKLDNAINRAIEYNGVFVGGAGLTPQDSWKSHIVEIGYWVGEEYWGMGIATDAVKHLTELAISRKKYKKLFAPVLGPNKASMRVLEKNKYQLEGVFKQEVKKNGTYYDIYSYAKECY